VQGDQSFVNLKGDACREKPSASRGHTRSSRRPRAAGISLILSSEVERQAQLRVRRIESRSCPEGV